VVFDVEDSVDPSQKQQAREAIATFLETPGHGAQRIVRFNAVETPEGARDIEFFGGRSGFEAVIVPKVEHAASLDAVARAFRGRPQPVGVLPLLETPLGVLRAAEIVQADASIPAILFGAEDLTARLGAARTVEGEELLFARGQIVMAAAIVRADALDAIYANVKDLEALRRDCERGRGIGFRGKMAIHPAQIPVIHDVFSPSAADVARARRIVDAFEAARAAGRAITLLDDEMVELPIVEKARRLLARAEPR
jgi:citrate lyase subunit beta/citryl-CoA lyase